MNNRTVVVRADKLFSVKHLLKTTETFKNDSQKVGFMYPLTHVFILI